MARTGRHQHHRRGRRGERGRHHRLPDPDPERAGRASGAAPAPPGRRLLQRGPGHRPHRAHRPHRTRRGRRDHRGNRGRRQAAPGVHPGQRRRPDLHQAALRRRLVGVRGREPVPFRQRARPCRDLAGAVGYDPRRRTAGRAVHRDHAQAACARDRVHHVPLRAELHGHHRAPLRGAGPPRGRAAPCGRRTVDAGERRRSRFRQPVPARQRLPGLRRRGRRRIRRERARPARRHRDAGWTGHRQRHALGARQGARLRQPDRRGRHRHGARQARHHRQP